MWPFRLGDSAFIGLVYRQAMRDVNPYKLPKPNESLLRPYSAHASVHYKPRAVVPPSPLFLERYREFRSLPAKVRRSQDGALTTMRQSCKKTWG
ncbi:hypothetical protein VTN00DRAFT_2108 [Thermoascus crustaceus]|uniref:uncharacterized protein n=1 Tax=Thermoascus crustaceus TaxID=5088 RepID=UPI00374319D3